MTKERAYSLLHVTKALDDGESRTLTGIATTPQADRVGDIVEPLGATFAEDLPLLWQHDHSAPVGRVKFGTPTREGIPFTATVAKVDEEGALKNRVDEAWQSVKSGLVRAVSIGFRVLDNKAVPNGTGITFKSTEIFELSLVTIPANADATIQTIKSFDTYSSAASGTSEEKEEGTGVSVETPATTSNKTNLKGKTKMTYAEQIQKFQKSLEAKQNEAQAMLDSSMEKGITFDDEQDAQYEEIQGEVKALEKHVARLQEAEETQSKSAQTVETNKNKAPAVQVQKELPQGVQMARYAKCIAAAGGNAMHAHELAKANYADTPAVAEVFRQKAAGTTTDEAWAAPLVQESNMVSEFVEMLRAQTIMGRLEGFRNVPFNIRVPRQTGGSSASWVGEGQRKPNSELSFDSVSLGHSKVAGIVPVTQELLNFSNPSVDTLIQNDLVATIARLIDNTFLDPSIGATEASPASILYGVDGIASSGTTAEAYEEDLAALVGEFTTANMSLSGAYFVMSESRAFNMGLIKDQNGYRAFEGMSAIATGGNRSIFGIPVVTSQADVLADRIVLIKPSEILVASDGGVDINISREASITMNEQLVSAWENNLVLTRAERMINWTKARPQAASFVDYSTAE